MAQMAIAWVLSHDFISSAIVGASRPEQLVDNLGAVGKKLDADLMTAIDEVLADVIVTDPRLTVSPNPRA